MQKLDRNLRISGLLILIALALPFAAVMWSNSANDFQYQGMLKWFWSSGPYLHCRALWHWSTFSWHPKHPHVFAWIWVSSSGLAALGVLCLLSHRMPASVRVGLAVAMPLTYLVVRFPLDIISLSWPSGPAILMQSFQRSDVNPFYVANIYSNPNVAAHYLVVLRVLLTAVAVLLPIGKHLADQLQMRERLGRDAWKFQVGALLLLSVVLPYGVTSRAFVWDCFVSNWSNVNGFWWYKLPQWYFWAGSVFLLAAAALWFVSWYRDNHSASFSLALLAAYLLLRAYSDLLSLCTLSNGNLRNPGFFLPVFLVLCRLYCTSYAVYSPVFRLLRGPHSQFHVPGPDIAVHAALAFSTTWIIRTWILGSIVTMTGHRVGLGAGWGQPITMGLFAVIPSIIVMYLIRLLSIRAGASPDLRDVRGRAARFLSVVTTAIAGPVLMFIMDWLP